MIGLQAFALQDAEPNLDLIEPGSIERQPADLEMDPVLMGGLQLLQPACQLFGGMRGSIIQDEDHRGHLASQGFWENDLLDKGLEIDKALAGAASPIDVPIGHAQACKQVAGASSMVARCMQLGFASSRGTRGLFAFPSLDGRFLIQAQ